MPLQNEIRDRSRKLTKLVEKETRTLLEGLEETIFETRTFLKRKKAYSEDTAYDYSDNQGWIETFDSKTEAICVRHYNMTEWRFIYIITKTSHATCIHCYQLFDDLCEDLKDNSVNDFIKNAHSIYSFYTDNIEGNRYVERPNLAYFKEHYKEIIKEEKRQLTKLFQISLMKKSFIQDNPELEKLFELDRKLGNDVPKESSDGNNLVVCHTENAVFNYQKIYLACWYLTDILTFKDYA